MVFLESCKAGLILLLLVVWCAITCGFCQKFQGHMGKTLSSTVVSGCLQWRGFCVTERLVQIIFPSVGKIWTVFIAFKNSNSSQKVELFINIFIWFFLEFHQWREVLMINPTMAMNPLLTASGQQKIPLVPSPFETPTVDRYFFLK